MKKLLVLVSLTIGLSCSVSTHLINGTKYDRTAILEIEGLPTNLAYSWITGDLFFTLIDLNTLMNDEVETKMDQYVLRNGTAIKIDDINGQTTAIDFGGNVYFGTDKGVYKYDEMLGTSTFECLHDDIVQLAGNHNNVYAVVYPENEVYLIDTPNKIKVDEIPCANFLAVDDYDNIYYGSESNYVSVLLKGFKEPIQYFGLKSGAGRALTMSAEVAVLAATDGLYALKPDNVVPRKIAELDFVPAGVAIHGSSYYISENGKIFLYEPQKNNKKIITV